jgi:hypothetical protein
MEEVKIKDHPGSDAPKEGNKKNKTKEPRRKDLRKYTNDLQWNSQSW